MGRLRRVEEGAKSFSRDPARWAQMQPDAALLAIVAREVAGKTIAGVTFPSDPDVIEEATITDEVLRILAEGLENSNA
jgi:hypothetical protein